MLIPIHVISNSDTKVSLLLSTRAKTYNVGLWCIGGGGGTSYCSEQHILHFVEDVQDLIIEIPHAIILPTWDPHETVI